MNLVRCNIKLLNKTSSRTQEVSSRIKSVQVNIRDFIALYGYIDVMQAEILRTAEIQARTDACGISISSLACSQEKVDAMVSLPHQMVILSDQRQIFSTNADRILILTISWKYVVKSVAMVLVREFACSEEHVLWCRMGRRAPHCGQHTATHGRWCTQNDPPQPGGKFPGRPWAQTRRQELRNLKPLSRPLSHLVLLQCASPAAKSPTRNSST